MSSLKMLLLTAAVVVLGMRSCGAGSTVEAEVRAHLHTAEYNLRQAKQQQQSYFAMDPQFYTDPHRFGRLATPLDWDALGTTSNTLSWEIGELFRYGGPVVERIGSVQSLRTYVVADVSILDGFASAGHIKKIHVDSCPCPIAFGCSQNHSDVDSCPLLPKSSPRRYVPE